MIKYFYHKKIHDFCIPPLIREFPDSISDNQHIYSSQEQNNIGWGLSPSPSLTLMMSDSLPWTTAAQLSLLQFYWHYYHVFSMALYLNKIPKFMKARLWTFTVQTAAQNILIRSPQVGWRSSRLSQPVVPASTYSETNWNAIRRTRKIVKVTDNIQRLKNKIKNSKRILKHPNL